MTYQGIDTAARITAEQAKKLREQGVAFVCRYIGPESWGKTITPAEAKILRDNGLAILLCYETSAARMLGGARAGAEDGYVARQAAEELGVPSGTVIFFAADWDVQTAELPLCEAYLKTASYNTEQFGVGLYGGERVVSDMSGRGACYYFWQCVAWSNQFLPVADVRQYAWQGDPRAKAMAAATGIYAVDLDSADTLAGMWMPDVPQPETHWYDDTIAWATKEGIMDGTRPEDYATRAEVAQMIRNYNRRFEAEDAKAYSGLLER